MYVSKTLDRFKEKRFNVKFELLNICNITWNILNINIIQSYHPMRDKRIVNIIQ